MISGARLPRLGLVRDWTLQVPILQDGLVIQLKDLLNAEAWGHVVVRLRRHVRIRVRPVVKVDRRTISPPSCRNSLQLLLLLLY